MLMAMAVTPQTVYARDGDVNLAYQVVGSPGPDLLFVPTPRFPIELIWDDHPWPTTFASSPRSAD